MRALAALPLLALLAGPATPVRADDPALPSDVTPVEHVVQPGETLIGLTLQELGDAALWPQNWRLNPDLEDPHHLDPGQRILIYRRGGAPSAEIRALSKHVDKKPHPDPTWIAASVGDPLRERDGVRTYEKSSAELAFDDGARLTLGEQSLVFLQRVGASLRGAPTRTLEIVAGQADLSSPQSQPEKPTREVEILVGGARTTTRSGDAPSAQARARRAAEGGAQLMVFAGETEIEQMGFPAQIDEDVRKLIDRLPPEQKEVVVMRTYLGMSFKEIAEHTDVSINTALGRMRYALINMRKMIDKHDIALERA